MNNQATENRHSYRADSVQQALDSLNRHLSGHRISKTEAKMMIAVLNGRH